MPNYKRFDHRLQVLMTEEQHVWLAARGDEQQIPAAEVIRQLINREMRSSRRRTAESA